MLIVSFSSCVPWGRLSSSSVCTLGQIEFLVCNMGIIIASTSSGFTRIRDHACRGPGSRAHSGRRVTDRQACHTGSCITHRYAQRHVVPQFPMTESDTTHDIHSFPSLFCIGTVQAFFFN